MGKLLFIFLNIIFAVSVRASAADLQMPAVALINLENSGWTKKIIQELWTEAIDVLNKQCGVQPGTFKYDVLEGVQGMLYMHEQAQPTSIQSVFEASRKVSNEPIKIYFLRQFEDRSFATGVTFADWQDSDIRGEGDQEVMDSIWLASHPTDVKHKPVYSVIAHELTHLLTQQGMHVDSNPPNMMSIFRDRNNYILPEHCDLIKKRLKKWK